MVLVIPSLRLGILFGVNARLFGISDDNTKKYLQQRQGEDVQIFMVDMCIFLDQAILADIFEFIRE
jgi:hypothetical protein